MVRKFYILIAALYPVVAIAGFVLTLRADRFAIFDPSYLLVWQVLVPGALILLTIGLALTGRAPRRLWRLTLIVWIGLVTWGHVAMIEAASRSV